VVAANSLAGPPVQSFDEYQVKAAFLYNFAKFVQWPPESFRSAAESITICVMGLDPFGHFLEDTVAGRAIDGRSLIVRHISSVKQVTGCHIVFIGSAESKRSPLTPAEIAAPGVLTIGESDTSGAAGAIINFRLDGEKVRLDVNVDAADRAKLRISSRLLSLAHIVEGKGK
jgi:hypothetical protein